MVKTKCVYDAASNSDGLRVLVTRFWPRGVKKEAVDIWGRETAPDAEAIKLYKAGKIDWPIFKARYVERLKSAEGRAAVEALRGEIKAAAARAVTLLCACKDEKGCHRSVLKGLIRA